MMFEVAVSSSAAAATVCADCATWLMTPAIWATKRLNSDDTSVISSRPSSSHAGGEVALAVGDVLQAVAQSHERRLIERITASTTGRRRGCRRGRARS